MPLIKRYADLTAYKTEGLPEALKPLFDALPDIGDTLMRQQLVSQYMLPLEALEIPYTIGTGKNSKTFDLFARPTWRKLPNNPADKLEVTAHLIFFWKDRNSKWDNQPHVRLTDTIARARVEAIDKLLHRGC